MGSPKGKNRFVDASECNLETLVGAYGTTCVSVTIARRRLIDNEANGANGAYSSF